MIIHKPSGSLVLKVRSPERIRAVIPKSKLVDIQGHNLAVRHGLDETRVLRNLGIAAPSPMRYYYSWPGKFTPLSHQIDTAEFATLHRKCFIFNEMGTMKTSSVLWAADYLMQIGQVRKVLVIAPLSTLEHTWRKEVFNVAMHRTAIILHGTRKQREERLAQDVDFYVMNHHGVSILGDDLRKRTDIDLVIWDECSELRNARTKMYEDFTNMLRPDQRLWLLSGAPCPTAPTDAWALAKLVDPSRVPKFFGAFKRLTMVQLTQFKWVPRIGAHKIAFDAMQPAIRFRKEECINLPPVVCIDKECDLTPEQKKAYKDMKAKMVAEARTHDIVAVNAADQIGKLRQILAGVVKLPQTEEYQVLDHGPRFQVLLESIREASAKVVVIVPFKGITRHLESQLKEHYSCAIMNGDVSISKRNEIIRQFKESPDPHVLLCHPKVMSHGLTLTEADTMIFYAPIYSNDQYMQVRERLNRPGQTRHMTMVRIAANALEWSIYKALDERTVTQETILELYKRELSLGLPIK